MDFFSTLSFNTVYNKGIWGYAGEVFGWHIALWFTGFVLCAVISYFLGSLNFALIISQKKFKDDIRSHGSGNAGMTNVLRTYGKAAAAFTLIGDALKALVAVMIGVLINGFMGGYIAGFFCVLGHVFPIFFKFKGGKGVVVTAMTILCLNPLVFLILFVIFVLIVWGTKYLSLGSIMSVLIYPLVLNRLDANALNPVVTFTSMLLAALVIFLHRSNIKRLLEGNENKFSLKGKKKEKASDTQEVTQNEEN